MNPFNKDDIAAIKARLDFVISTSETWAAERKTDPDEASALAAILILNAFARMIAQSARLGAERAGRKVDLDFADTIARGAEVYLKQAIMAEFGPLDMMDDILSVEAAEEGDGETCPGCGGPMDDGHHHAVDLEGASDQVGSIMFDADNDMPALIVDRHKMVEAAHNLATLAGSKSPNGYVAQLLIEALAIDVAESVRKGIGKAEINHMTAMANSSQVVQFTFQKLMQAMVEPAAYAEGATTAAPGAARH